MKSWIEAMEQNESKHFIADTLGWVSKAPFSIHYSSATLGCFLGLVLRQGRIGEANGIRGKQVHRGGTWRSVPPFMVLREITGSTTQCRSMVYGVECSKCTQIHGYQRLTVSGDWGRATTGYFSNCLVPFLVQSEIVILRYQSGEKHQFQLERSNWISKLLSFF